MRNTVRLTNPKWPPLTKPGPIVRISPTEIHINDPEFYETLYSTSAPRNKDPWFTTNFDVAESAFSTLDYRLHRPRRALIAPYFAKARVDRIQPLIQGKITKLMRQLDEYARAGKPLKVDVAYNCFTADVITGYTSYRPLGYLDTPDMVPIWSETVRNLVEIGMIARHLPGFFPLLASTGARCIQMIYPKLLSVIAFRVKCIQEVNFMWTHPETATKDAAQAECSEPALFPELVSRASTTPDITEERVLHEFITIVAAGTETTAHTMTVCTFHILNNKDILRRLRAELNDKFPGDATMDLQTLEQLPYLVGLSVDNVWISNHMTDRSRPGSSTKVYGMSISIF